MKNFAEAEKACLSAFEECGQAFHLYTSGKETPVLFVTHDDMAFVMNVIALTYFKWKLDVKILAFAVMNNHFHFVICGNRDDAEEFFHHLKKKLKRSFPDIGALVPCLKPIDTLAGMRNCIAYIHRNGYVANPGFTPFSYPWGTGKYYFNQIPSTGSFSEVGYTENRKMFRGCNEILPGYWQMTDGYIVPQCYCSLELGMSMFRDSHHYYFAVSRNVESYSELAVELDDDEFLTDQELFSQVGVIVREQYHLPLVRDLTRTQKYDLAKTLRFRFHSSNGQISRVLGLTQYEVDSLFPVI